MPHKTQVWSTYEGKRASKQFVPLYSFFHLSLSFFLPRLGWRAMSSWHLGSNFPTNPGDLNFNAYRWPLRNPPRPFLFWRGDATQRAALSTNQPHPSERKKKRKRKETPRHSSDSSSFIYRTGDISRSLKSMDCKICFSRDSLAFYGLKSGPFTIP